MQRCVEKPLAARDILTLLLDWTTLRWTPLGHSDLSSGEWMTQTDGYRVNIFDHPGSPLFHSDVAQRILAFLGVKVELRDRTPYRSSASSPSFI